MRTNKIIIALSITTIYQSMHSMDAEPPGYSDHPNIVLIMADDLGFSDIGCYGGEIQTPNLDSLANKGLRFTQFYNAGRCWPTRSSLLTGYYPQQINADGERAGFPEWGYLLSHHLKQAGYRNYHSGKWHIPDINTQIAQGGFDRSYCIADYDNHFSQKNHFLDDKKLTKIKQDNAYYSTTAIADYAVNFLKEHKQHFSDSPFFLYVAFIAPHFPLQAPQEEIEKYRDHYLEGWEKLKMQRFERQKELGFNLGENSAFEYFVTAPWSWPEKWLKDSIPGEMRLSRPWNQLTCEEQHLQTTKMAIHAAMVDCMDQEIGRILSQLKCMGVDKNTLVLFLSDNGASAEQIIRGEGHDINVSPGSAGSYLCLGPGFSTASNTPFRRHKYYTHEGGIATPMIAWWPQGIEDAGEFRSSLCSIIDFLPTFLELAEIDALKERNGFEAPPLPGNSLVPLFSEDQPSYRELYFSHQGNKALRQGKWKAVISSDTDGRWQLYDMEEDRTELNNLSDNFHNSFGNLSWKKSKQEILEQMKTRWDELNKLYQKQGKQEFYIRK